MILTEIVKLAFSMTLSDLKALVDLIGGVYTIVGVVLFVEAFVCIASYFDKDKKEAEEL